MPANILGLHVNERREQWRQVETTEKVDGQCKGGQGDKEISFQTTYDHHTKQNRVETSGSSLIIILKMMEERKEGL